MNRYPTDNELEYIQKFEVIGPERQMELFKYIYNIWEYGNISISPQKIKDRGDGTVWYTLITGGWSGNEEIIDAMKANLVFWARTWESSDRSGKHVFSVKL